MELKKTGREKGLVINNISLVGGKGAGGGEAKRLQKMTDEGRGVVETFIALEDTPTMLIQQ